MLSRASGKLFSSTHGRGGGGCLILRYIKQALNYVKSRIREAEAAAQAHMEEVGAQAELNYVKSRIREAVAQAHMEEVGA